jgi:hypothetical protein
VRDPLLWFDLLAPMLLGALGHHDPQLRYKLRAATAAWPPCLKGTRRRISAC